MLDAGLSGRRITTLMSHVGIGPEEISGILLTHEHSDHVKGAGVLSRRYKLSIYANKNTLRCSNIGSVTDSKIFNTMQPFSIGPLTIRPLPISHNAAEPNAFHISCESKSMLLATDLGVVNNEIYAALREVDLAMIESNHDLNMLIQGPYPPMLKTAIRSERGHLSNVDCARALWSTAREGRKIFLAHLSKNNNTPELARRTVARTLCCCEDTLECMMGADDVRSIIV
ncbi:MAG: MBL fold metallo-hydrolase [Euryarchaeota archaeon]|nr:MBL fold metallo-hydrolase [Euryarchaeota archaeon]